MVGFDDNGIDPDMFDQEIAMLSGSTGNTGGTFLDIPLYNSTSLMQLALHFAFNLLVCCIMVWCFYYPKSRNKNFSVTFMLFSTAVFLLLFFMKSVGIDVGIGLGLFMIFGIIRYRTEMVPIREMTYLFLTIAIAVINGSNLIVSYAELGLANVLVIALLAVLEYGVMRRREASKLVCYERIELIRPERRAELIADLETRLGVKVHKVEVGNVDFLRDVAFLKVYYRAERGECGTHDSTLKINEKNAFNE